MASTFFQGMLDCNFPLLLRLNYLSTESLLLPLICLTLNLHLGTIEVQIRLQSTNLRGQLLLGFSREKEVNMVLRERLTE
jgi:hypothetical protein